MGCKAKTASIPFTKVNEKLKRGPLMKIQFVLFTCLISRTFFRSSPKCNRQIKESVPLLWELLQGRGSVQRIYIKVIGTIQLHPRLHPFTYMYSGTRLESKLLVFFGFSVCSHVYLLNYTSELAQIWRQDTDTIHDHNHTKKKKFQCKCGPQ